MLTLFVQLVPLFAALAPAKAPQEPLIAVISVHTDGTADVDSSVDIGGLLSRQLQQSGARVMPQSEVRERLARFLVPTSADLKKVTQLQKDSEAYYATFDLPKSVASLEKAVQLLQQDTAPTEAKQKLLEQLRIKLADKLIGMAGKRESGRGETKLGQRSLSTFADALRANPMLAISPSMYPPKTRRIFEAARQKISKGTMGRLEVTSQPSGATVFLEGRPMGTTPLLHTGDIPAGEYRLWVAKEQHKSRVYPITIGKKKTSLEIDLAFESSLIPERAAVKPLLGELLSEETALKTGAALGVDWIIITGTAQLQQERWVYSAVYDVNTNSALRRGAVIEPKPLTQPALKHAINSLAVFLASGEGLGKSVYPFPPEEENTGVARVEPRVKAEQSPPLGLFGHVAFWSGLAAVAAGGGSHVMAVQTYTAVQDEGEFDQVQANNIWSAMAVAGYAIGTVAMAGGVTLWVLSAVGNGNEEPSEDTPPVTESPTEGDEGQTAYANRGQR